MSAPPHDDDDDFDDDFLSEVAKVEDLSPPSADSFMPKVGDRLGHFLIVAQLGRGGMGIVFLGEDERLGRRVALKLLPASVAADPNRRARLLREARAAAAVSHPNLVAVHETGEEDGRVFIVLEYVAGDSLRRVLDDRELSIGEAIAYARKMLEGLAHAHGQGLLHRDLKPENVLVGEDGCVKILDFGLAKLEGEPIDPTASGLTREGHILGTPGYMAPEQARGRVVDARADVFAFGATFFEMLTGHRAFHGETPADIVSAVLRDEPARADAIRPEVGAALADICGRCLEKTPSERFSSCEEILDALDAPELGIPAAFPPERASVRRVSSPSLPPPTRAGSNDAPAAPRRFLTYALVAAVAAIGGVAIYMRPKPIAGPTAAASASAAATAITDVPPPKSSSPAALAAYAHALQASRDADWGLAREQYKEALALDPKLAPAHLRIAMIMNFEKDGPSESRAEFAKALNGRADLSPRDQAIANALEPVIARDPGENDLTTQRLRELTVKYPNDAEIHHTYAVFGMYGSADGIAAERRAIQIDPQYADAWQILGGELAVAGHREEALAALAKCVEIAPLSADCRGERARLYSLDGQCGKAEDDLRRALSSSSRSVLMWHEDRAAALFAIGRSDETVIEALRPKWQLYSDARRQSVELYDRALLAVSRGRFAEAERLLIQGETAIENDPNSDPHVRYASLRIGVLNETGRPKEAAKVAKVFLDKKDLWLSRQFASDRTVPMLRVMEHAGLIPMSQVIKERDAWLEHAKSLGTGEPPSFLWSAAYVANMERRDEAQAAFDAQPTQELGHPRQMIDMEVGTMYALLGRSAEAIPHLSRAVRQCDWFRWPIWNTIAVERLGDAYAETNQKKEACEAYALVTTRWASATKSVTRDLAKEHAARLGCGALASQPLIAMPEPAAPAAPPPFPGVDVRVWTGLPNALIPPVPPGGFVAPPAPPVEIDEEAISKWQEAFQKAEEKRRAAEEKRRAAEQKRREKPQDD